MEEKIRKYVYELFNGNAETKKAVELKEEMIQNLNDKYNDLISEGKTPEAAYNIAIAGIGDVSGLLHDLERDYYMPDMADYEVARSKSAMFTAIAVMTYILSILPYVFLSSFTSYSSARTIGIPIMFIMVAGATGLLVYNRLSQPRFSKRGETIVDEFREWQSGARDKKTFRRSISSALWSVLLVLYFVISFSTGAWHVTWITFLVGAALEAFINIFFTYKK